MDAEHVRAFLDALPDAAPDGRAVARVRSCLAALGDPDVRYLVARISGAGAPAVARVSAAALEAAGAPTATLGRSSEDTRVAGVPLDDALLAHAGTLAASAVYDLHHAQPELGEMTRREGWVLIGAIAFAEAAQRVALLLDEDGAPDDPAHALRPDLVVFSGGDEALVTRALAAMPASVPAVSGALDPAARRAIETWAQRGAAPLLLAGRDHEVRPQQDRSAFLVRGEPFVTFDPVDDIDAAALSCGLATALALGAMGIRMREEWLLRGLDALRPSAVAL